MGWSIKCTNARCQQESWASNVVDLIQNHRDGDGWFQCSKCSSPGYIEKRYELQESGETFEPYLRGIISLGKEGDTYQPFVFLVSYSPDDAPEDVDVWFSYYKDTRSEGGRLKLGHGPGGPPVLCTAQILQLVSALVGRGCLDKAKVMEATEA